MKYISINGHTIRRNALHGTAVPPIRVAQSKSDTKPTYANEIELIGSARLVYDPHQKIMRCGARLVIVADDVRIVS